MAHGLAAEAAPSAARGAVKPARPAGFKVGGQGRRHRCSREPGSGPRGRRSARAGAGVLHRHARRGLRAPGRRAGRSADLPHGPGLRGCRTGRERPGMCGVSSAPRGRGTPAREPAGPRQTAPNPRRADPSRLGRARHPATASRTAIARMLRTVRLDRTQVRTCFLSCQANASTLADSFRPLSSFLATELTCPARKNYTVRG